MSSTRHLALGLFVLLALGVLSAYTIFLSGMNVFGDVELWTVQFPEANGLRPGDPVRVAGMRVGRVQSLAFDPNAPEAERITVELRLDQPIELREGYEIRIEETTLLGGRNVDIEPGPAGAAPLA
ncbi:MAG TPA: MlaD family protein, partial [Planctomycetota bacterium]|nr:MlaD family protein [Planctomycetota bacterium]